MSVSSIHGTEGSFLVIRRRLGGEEERRTNMPAIVQLLMGTLSIPVC